MITMISTQDPCFTGTYLIRHYSQNDGDGRLPDRIRPLLDCLLFKNIKRCES